MHNSTSIIYFQVYYNQQLKILGLIPMFFQQVGVHYLTENSLANMVILPETHIHLNLIFFQFLPWLLYQQSGFLSSLERSSLFHASFSRFLCSLLEFFFQVLDINLLYMFDKEYINVQLKVKQGRLYYILKGNYIKISLYT